MEYHIDPSFKPLTFHSQAVLDIETGTWARLLPAGDPGASTGQPARFPLPREGAAAISFPSALVGSNPSVGSDTIIFGGQLANGTYMNDVWLLRAYMGALTESGQSWSGFGNGTLESGQDATGSGVTIQYLSTCAKLLSPPPSTNGDGANPDSPPPSGGGSSSGSQKVFPFDTSAVHKILSPLSVALALGAVVAFRLTSPSIHGEGGQIKHSQLAWVTAVVASVAYVVGLVGFVIAFTSIKPNARPTNLRKRADSPRFLETPHARAGFVFFVALYVVFPIMVITLWWLEKFSRWGLESRLASAERSRKDSVETGLSALANAPPAREKANSRRNHSPSQSTVDQLNATSSPPISPRRRSMSWQGGKFWSSYFGRSNSPRRSSESAGDSPNTANPPTRSFEVLNRGPRVRRQSNYGINGQNERFGFIPRSLSDLSWLDRRRSVNAVVCFYM